MNGSSVAVAGLWPARFARRLLGWSVALSAATLCAFLFATPARADDPATVGDASAQSSSSDTSTTTADGSSTADTSDAPTTAADTSDASGTTDASSDTGTSDAADATEVSDITDTSSATSTSDTSAPAADATDTSATTTDASASTPDTTNGCAAAPGPTETSATTTDSSTTVADTSGACPAAPNATDTTGDASATEAPTADPSDTTPTPATAEPTTATSTAPPPVTDPEPPPSPQSSSSAAADPPSSPPSFNAQAPSDATPTAELSESTSNDQGAEADVSIDSPVDPVATTLGGGEPLSLTFPGVVTRCDFDCRVGLGCGATTAVLPLTSWPALPEATQGVRQEERTNSGPSRPAGAHPPSPRLPVPEHAPQMPSAPGASSGSSSSGGAHDGSTLGVAAAALSLTPRNETRPISLIELRRRVLPFAFLLDRPG
jgi:hypothetical protein